MANFFKNFEFFHSGVRQTKNIMVPCPLFFTYRKKIFKTCHTWGSNPRSKPWQDFILPAQPIEPPGLLDLVCDFIQPDSPLI